MSERRPWQIDDADIEAFTEGPAEESRDSGRASQESAPEPRFLREARERAEKEGRSVSDILAADVLAALENEYPGPDCLSPEQIAECVSGEATAAELSHLETCCECRKIVELGRPNVVRRKEFLALARSSKDVAEPSMSPRSSDRQGSFTLPRARVALMSAGLACSFLAGLASDRFYTTVTGEGLHRAAMKSLSFSPTGSDAVFAGNAGKYWLLDLDGERQPIEFKANADSKLRWPKFSADGKHVTASGPKGEIAVWDLGQLETGATERPQIYPSLKEWTAAIKDTDRAEQ